MSWKKVCEIITITLNQHVPNVLVLLILQYLNEADCQFVETKITFKKLTTMPREGFGFTSANDSYTHVKLFDSEKITMGVLCVPITKNAGFNNTAVIKTETCLFVIRQDESKKCVIGRYSEHQGILIFDKDITYQMGYSWKFRPHKDGALAYIDENKYFIILDQDVIVEVKMIFPISIFKHNRRLLDVAYVKTYYVVLSTDDYRETAITLHSLQGNFIRTFKVEKYVSLLAVHNNVIWVAHIDGAQGMYVCGYTMNGQYIHEHYANIAYALRVYDECVCLDTKYDTTLYKKCWPVDPV